MGQNEQAKFWIEKGLKINPGVHYGSEWIYLNILKAKLHKANSLWLRDNPILGLDFGTAYFPQFQNIHVSRNIDNMDDLAYEAKLQ